MHDDSINNGVGEYNAIYLSSQVMDTPAVYWSCEQMGSEEWIEAISLADPSIGNLCGFVVGHLWGILMQTSLSPQDLKQIY